MRSIREKFAILHQVVKIKKDVPNCGGHDPHHLAQVEYVQGKGLTLIGFLLYRS
jgi:hypothetical protein